MAVNLSIDQIEARQGIHLGPRQVLQGPLAGGAIQPELDDLNVPAQRPGEDPQRRAVRLADPDGVDRVQGGTAPSSRPVSLSSEYKAFSKLTETLP